MKISKRTILGNKSNRSGQMNFLSIPTWLGFVLGLLIFFLILAPDIDDSIGSKQASVIRAVGHGEQQLSYVDTAARLSAWESLFELGEKGGFYSDVGDEASIVSESYPCKKYVYNLWTAQEENCWPDPEAAYERYFIDNFQNNFLHQIGNVELSNAEYIYTFQNDVNNRNLVVTGLTDARIPILMHYEATYVKEGPRTVPEDIFVEDEEIVKCCDGECIKGVAEKYYGMYGVDSARPFPYVWGGETPYNVQETKDKTKEKDSFFWGVGVTDFEPPREGRPRTETRPGFDCSGWSWWVYKHAGIPDFNVRMSAKEYEKLSNAQLVCSDSSSCNQAMEDGTAKPGDVVFMHDSPSSPANHIAIYVGDGEVIESSVSKDGVVRREFVKALFTNSHITMARYPFSSSCDVTGNFYTSPSGSKPSEAGSAGGASTGEVYELGALSEYYESGGRGSGTIGYDTTGKTSYGKYQISSPSMPSFLDFIRKKEYGLYNPLYSAGNPNCESYCDSDEGSEECYISSNRAELCIPKFCYIDCKFARIWKEEVNKGSFDTGLEHEFIKTRYYDPAVNAVKKTCQGLDVNQRSFALQNVLWSTAVQHGSSGAATIFRRAGASPDESDVNIIKGVYKERKNVDKYFKSSTSKVKESVRARFINEEKTALEWFASNVKGTTVTTTSSRAIYFTPEDIGYYYVNPSFTTEVPFDIKVFDGITAWARKTFEDCSGIQKDLGKCVEENMEDQNKAVDSAVDSFMSNPSFGSVGMFSLMNLATSNLLFKFADTAECDGDDKGYYQFIETFEDCFDHGHPNCRCEFPTGKASRFSEINLSKDMIKLHVKLKDDERYEYYDFSDKKDFQLFHDKNEYDYVIIKNNGKKYELKFYKDGKEIKAYDYSEKEFYLVRNAKGFDDFVSNADELQKCELEGRKHKFRFCVISPAEPVLPKAYYDIKGQAKVKFENVSIRFALDLHDSIPGAIVDTESDDLYLSDEQDKKQQDAKNLPEDKKCEGLGKAKIKLEVTTQDLVPAYEQFISSIATKIVPQLAVLLFAKNVLALDDFLPAMVSVEIDLNGASEDCNIAGIVYKCGVGVAPYKGVDKFDFSNPTGYIDLTSKFNTKTEYSSMPPNACMLFRNPDESFMDGPIRYMKPDIEGDIISFSITKCTDPIAQYKKMSGMDIISSALHGFGYYFAFAYVNSDDEYGRPSVMTVQIPSVLTQLEDQLGITEWLVLKDVLLGNYDSVFKLLGVEDEYMFFRRALSSASLDQLLRNLRDDVLNSAFDEVGKNIKNDDAREIFDDLARDAADGRLDNDYSRELLEKAKEELTPEEVDEFIENLDDDVLWEAYYYIEELPLQKKKELLAEVYENRAEITGMAEDEVDEKLEEAMEKKEKAVKIIREIDPEDKIAFAKQVMDDAPSMALGAVMNAFDDDKKVAAVKDVLSKASNKKNDLARIITHASPDYVKKQAIEYITDNVPGFSKYKDLIEIFSGDLEDVGC